MYLRPSVYLLRSFDHGVISIMMDTTFIVGLIIIVGFLFGKIAEKTGLPKASGYILAGVALNPQISTIIPPSFPDLTEPVTNICLAFITFEVGGSLSLDKIKKLGRGILNITFFESVTAFLFVLAGFFAVIHFLDGYLGANLNPAWAIPFSMLVASLAAPTDPSATLAVSHEYHARGMVSDTIMGVAAFDDAMGMILYSIAGALALSLTAGGELSFLHVSASFLMEIGISVLTGFVFGYLFNRLTRFFKLSNEAQFIVIILGLMALCFGASDRLGGDPLLSTMSLGFIIVNYNTQQEVIFDVLQRYTEELIFIFFFTISGMHLLFSSLVQGSLLIALFVVLRAAGKFSGTLLGAHISKMSRPVKKYTGWGLIPQGGIVIGLALAIRKEAAFGDFSDLLLGIIMGATIIHELIGPVLAKMTLKRAGEIKG